MKTILTTIVLIFACFGTTRAAASVPSLLNTHRIYIGTDSGWSLRVNIDGSASLQFGSGPMDSARCPAGTFVLSDIYNLLVSKLKEKRAEDDIAVAIWSSGATSTTVRYVDRSEVKPILTKAPQQSTALDKARFDALVKDHPIELLTP